VVTDGLLLSAGPAVRRTRRMWIDVRRAGEEDARAMDNQPADHPVEMEAEHRSRGPAPAGRVSPLPWSVKLWGGRKRSGEPPLERGRWPYLGCAPEFGRDPGGFLTACRQRHGDVFTVLLAGHRTTFVLDPFSYPIVLKLQRELTFDPIADEIAAPTFGYPRAHEINVDEDALRELYGAYLKNQSLAVLGERMQERLTAALEPLDAPGAGWRGDQLYDFVYRHLFQAGGETLFGDGVAKDEVRERFRRFDRVLPLLMAGVPASLLGIAGTRRQLAALFGVERPHTSEFMRRRDEYLRVWVTEEARRHFQFTMLWAAQANTLPGAFWALAHILHDRTAYAEITAEVRAGMDESEGHLDAEALRRLVKLQSAVSEALRLCAGSMTLRHVERDMTLTLDGGRSYALRAGDRVVLYPYVTPHRDPEIFPEPERFQFDRFLAPGGGVKQFFKGGRRVTTPLMPYGGGVSMCPGRFLANGEILQFIALLFERFDMELLETELPRLDQSRAGLGILPPLRDIRFRYGSRQSVSPRSAAATKSRRS
jgi:cytochrome P450